MSGSHTARRDHALDDGQLAVRGTLFHEEILTYLVFMAWQIVLERLV